MCNSSCAIDMECSGPNICTRVRRDAGSSSNLTCMVTYPIEHIILHYNNTANCSSPCGTNKNCTGPETCTCISGWTGDNCSTRMNVFY